MVGCVVGADRAEVAERLAARDALTGGVDGEPVSGTVDEVVEQLRAFAAVGVERAMLQHLVHADLEMIPLLGQVGDGVAEA